MGSSEAVCFIPRERPDASDWSIQSKPLQVTVDGELHTGCYVVGHELTVTLGGSSDLSKDEEV